MTPYSVFFLGTPDFACPALQALIDDDRFSVDLVISQPDRKVGRKQILTSPPVTLLAKEHGIPLFQPEKLNTAWNERPVTNVPDYIVVVAYGQILNEEILQAPRIAPVNIHASLLPKWRGASPIQHAVLHGDTESGVTLQRMVRELDAGPILSQESVQLSMRETSQTLHDTLAKLGAALLTKTLSTELTETEQDASKATFCSKLSREDGKVDPAQSTAEEIDRTVRALVPWPGVTMPIEGEELKILETALHPTPDAVEIPCAQGTTLFVQTLQPPGKTPMTGKQWQQGRK